MNMKRLLALALVFALSAPAFGWNETGHMVTARLAWRRLTEAQRAEVIAVLKKHPHYEEYLTARKPDGFTEEEWAFLRAATWADWVRSHHKEQFDHPTWHYINYPIVWKDSKVDASKYDPPAKQENVVNQLAVCVSPSRRSAPHRFRRRYSERFHQDSPTMRLGRARRMSRNAFNVLT
jgi:hypothetical protein